MLQKTAHSEVCNFCSSPDIRVVKSRGFRCTGHAAWFTEMKYSLKILVGNHGAREGLLRRPRHGWEYNTEMDLGETWLEGVDWTQLAQDRN
jgi:hypothetical protein